jgi:hypothetical protein
LSAITVEQAQAQLNAYLAAETAALAGQSYEIAGRRLTRANLKDIREGIEYWSRRVGELTTRSAGRSRARTIVTGG